MDRSKLEMARAKLEACLRDESQALANAQNAADTGGVASEKSVSALRAAQVAHARSHSAVRELRALAAEAACVDPALPAPGTGSPTQTPEPQS